MKVIILNGPMGVGKTTVGKYIADHCPGTAFIDGDWCLDLHPFVGNRETKAMAVDNILHMIGNYSSEIIFGAATFVEKAMRIEQIKQLVFPHPTVCEIIREAVNEIKF